MVIGISGALRAGKDVVAARLVSGWGFERVSFADGLREELLERMPRTLRALHDHCCPHPADHFGHGPDAEGMQACVRHMLYVSKPAGFRELLQEYGSEVRRGDDPDYWTKRWAERVPRGALVVAPDVRFPNEAQAVLDMGGVLWRVERPGLPVSDHQSETALSGWHRWDEVIANDGTIDALWAKVDGLAGRLIEVGA